MTGRSSTPATGGRVSVVSQPERGDCLASIVPKRAASPYREHCLRCKRLWPCDEATCRPSGGTS